MNTFYGQKISEYGIEHNRVDYRALAASFDAVLCNDITKLFYGDVNGEYCEAEQVHGFIDNSEEIEELQEQLDEMQDALDDLQNELDEIEIETDADIEKYKQLETKINTSQEQIDEIQEQIDELEQEQDESPEIFQYYIISDSGYNILKYHTNEIIYYLESLDVYIWGVTHWGTSWDYVLTDIKIEEE
jgi:DNA repair ATPase RecN